MKLLDRSAIYKNIILALADLYTNVDALDSSADMYTNLSPHASRLTDLIINFNNSVELKAPLPSDIIGGIMILSSVKKAIVTLETDGTASSLSAAEKGLNILFLLMHIDMGATRRANILKALCDETLEASSVKVSKTVVESLYVDGLLPEPVEEYIPPPTGTLTFEGEEIPLTNATIDDKASKESILDW